LTNAAVRRKALSREAKMHHRRMFVAMSRPRRLLCMAAAAAHIDDATRAQLAAQGWVVEDLTTQSAASATPGDEDAPPYSVRA
jgi:hypothetical protein